MEKGDLTGIIRWLYLKNPCTWASRNKHENQVKVQKLEVKGQRDEIPIIM